MQHSVKYVTVCLLLALWDKKQIRLQTFRSTKPLKVVKTLIFKKILTFILVIAQKRIKKFKKNSTDLSSADKSYKQF